MRKAPLAANFSNPAVLHAPAMNLLPDPHFAPSLSSFLQSSTFFGIGKVRAASMISQGIL